MGGGGGDEGSGRDRRQAPASERRDRAQVKRPVAGDAAAQARPAVVLRRGLQAVPALDDVLRADGEPVPWGALDRTALIAQRVAPVFCGVERYLLWEPLAP